MIGVLIVGLFLFGGLFFAGAAGVAVDSYIKKQNKKQDKLEIKVKKVS